jgi:protocatechuate 3,4-dioxygenase beta subunit
MPAVVPLALIALCCPQQPTVRTYALTGEVVDMLGEPIVGATVWAAPSGRHQDRSRAVQSDARGHFRIAGIPKTYDWREHAEADGYCRVSHWTGSGPRPVRLTLQQAVELQGLVRDAAGNPVAGARVFAQPTHRLLGNSVTHTTTDEHGLTETRLRVREADEVSLRFGRAPRTEVRITLTGLSDEELRHVTIGLGTELFGSTPEHIAPFRSPARGRDRLVLSVPDQRLGVHPEGLGVRFAPDRASFERGKGPHVVTFAARKPPQVRTRQRVRLLDADGAPVAGVRTAIYGADGQSPVTGISDDAGWLTFELRIEAGKHGWLYLRDGRWLITDAAPLGSPYDNHRFVVAPDEPMQVRLQAACAVTGRLLRADGEPAAFADVVLQHEVGGHWQRVASTTSTANGDFACDQLQTRSDRLRVVVRSQHGSLNHRSDDLKLAESGTRVQLGTLKLTPPAIVTGIVATDAGAPIAGVFVSLHGKDDSGDYQENAVTDAAGRFRFVGVPPGRGEVYVGIDGGRRSAYQVRAGQRFEWRRDHGR